MLHTIAFPLTAREPPHEPVKLALHRTYFKYLDRKQETSMPHFILTGAPGAGKTMIIGQLQGLGFPIVEEAATEVIARFNAVGDEAPHTMPEFVDQIAAVQDARREPLKPPINTTVFHDRSLICTLALARFLGFPPSPSLQRRLDQIQAEQFFDQRVFFIRNLDSIRNTSARQIDFDQAVVFERVHEHTYRELGYGLVDIAPQSVEARANAVLAAASQNRWEEP